MRGFGLPKKLSIEGGFAFSKKGLKSEDLQFRMKTTDTLFKKKQ